MPLRKAPTVAVPKSHPLFGKSYDKANEMITIHGGLTFANAFDESIDWFPRECKGMWILGFDCAHAWDTPQNCPQSYVEAETEDLKIQLELISYI